MELERISAERRLSLMKFETKMELLIITTHTLSLFLGLLIGYIAWGWV